MTMIHVASPTTLVGHLICRVCHHIQADLVDDCPRCGTIDAFAPIQSWQETRHDLMSSDRENALLKTSTRMLTEYERLGVIHPQYIAFENCIATEYDPEEIGKLAAAWDNHSVVPGIITQHEFRARYGYRCKRIPCTFCQNFHYCGSNADRTCRNIAGPSNMDSGTRYRVSRADETFSVAIELSAKTAWNVAYEREYARFIPILIARDALVEGRFEVALQIAACLDPDLADPLRREINHHGKPS